MTDVACRDVPNAPRALRINDHENKADFCRPRMSMRGARGISSFQLSVWKKPAAFSRRCGLSDRIESIPIESICNRQIWPADTFVDFYRKKGAILGGAASRIQNKLQRDPMSVLRTTGATWLHQVCLTETLASQSTRGELYKSRPGCAGPDARAKPVCRSARLNGRVRSRPRISSQADALSRDSSIRFEETRKFTLARQTRKCEIDCPRSRDRAAINLKRNTAWYCTFLLKCGHDLPRDDGPIRASPFR